MAKPAFEPTAAQRRRVSIIAGAGWTQEEIAICLGISRSTLIRYFPHELTVGAYERHAEIIEAMHKSASNGNAAAQKNYAALHPRVAAPPVPADPVPAAPEGKKAKAAADAVTAQKGTDWESLLGKQSLQ